MATKTISIDVEAYERLNRARKSPDESFSRVIKRAQWPEERPRTAAALLEAFEDLPLMDDEALDYLDAAQREEAPAADKWRAR